LHHLKTCPSSKVHSRQGALVAPAVSRSPTPIPSPRSVHSRTHPSPTSTNHFILTSPNNNVTFYFLCRWFFNPYLHWNPMDGRGRETQSLQLHSPRLRKLLPTHSNHPLSLSLPRSRTLPLAFNRTIKLIVQVPISLVGISFDENPRYTVHDSKEGCPHTSAQRVLRLYLFQFPPSSVPSVSIF